MYTFLYNIFYFKEIIIFTFQIHRNALIYFNTVQQIISGEYPAGTK